MNCCSCGGAAFGDVLDLGPMPLVNNLLERADQAAERWPLKVVFCRSCSLAQLTETPPAGAMFDEYLYFSSQSQTMVAHAGELVARFVRPGDRVIEIASNDGYLLKQAQTRGATVLGVDPARNIAAYANKQGVPTRCEFFNTQTAGAIARDWGRCDVMFANNVLAHVPDPNEIAAGIAAVLAPMGKAHVEVPYARRMIEAGAFDTIYHEHKCYFSIAALKTLFNRHGLRLTGVEIAEIHGGSVHVQLSHQGDESNAERIIESERELGMFDDRFYANFAKRVNRTKSAVLEAISRFKTVGAYGAAAKGVVLLNTFGLTADRIPWVADVSPHKQGRFIPGTRQPIVSPEFMVRARPSAALLLPWNLKVEVMRRNQAYLDQGGHFIVPIPEVEIV